MDGTQRKGISMSSIRQEGRDEIERNVKYFIGVLKDKLSDASLNGLEPNKSEVAMARVKLDEVETHCEEIFKTEQADART